MQPLIIFSISGQGLMPMIFPMISKLQLQPRIIIQKFTDAKHVEKYSTKFLLFKHIEKHTQPLALISQEAVGSAQLILPKDFQVIS